MIRVKRERELHINGMRVRGWLIEGEGETLFGDLNDPSSQAGMVLIAAIFVHAAGFAGFTLEHCEPLPECFDAVRVTRDAIKRAREERRPWWRFWR